MLIISHEKFCRLKFKIYLWDGSNFIGYLGQDHRKGAKTFFEKKYMGGGEDFFSKKKIGGRRVFFEKKRVEDFFSKKKLRGEDFFTTKFENP